MKYGIRFLSALVAFCFGVFLGATQAGEEGHRKQKNDRGQRHQQQQQPPNRQARPPIERRQQQPDKQFVDRGPQKQPNEAEGVRRDRQRNITDQKNIGRSRGDAAKDRRDIRRDRHDGRNRRDGHYGRHRDFRPAHRNEHHYRGRHDHMRRFITHDRYVTWRHRHREFYHVYYSRPFVVYYDWINPYWPYWLYDHPQYLYLWVYHHRYEMAAERYAALLNEIADLEARIHELAERGIEVDPNYSPPGIDEDMVYSEEYIERYRQR